MKQLRGRETFAGWLGHMHHQQKKKWGGKEKDNYIHIRIYILYRLAVCRGWVEVVVFFAWGTRAVGQSERLRDENVFL